VGRHDFAPIEMALRRHLGASAMFDASVHYIIYRINRKYELQIFDVPEIFFPKVAEGGKGISIAHAAKQETRLEGAPS
jgi:hypothetical protein